MDASSSVENTSQTMLVQLTTDGVPKLHCPVCNKALVSLNGYVQHVKKHDPPGGFICRYCEARFCSEDALKHHLKMEHTTIVCRICKGLTFPNETDYREHIRTAHNGIDRELYKCEKCSAEYKTYDPYRRHIDTECGSIKPFKCDQCEMSFVTKYNLKQHKESHLGKCKFCCSYCGKNFLQKGRLVEHERSHTGEKPYKCDVCGKCFAHRESIVTHSSIHTGIRLVECRCCQSRFSCHSNLIKHRRTRPDSCGQSIYDPPKTRKRMNRTRIPATLNPTSEIKVSCHNKIIKPDDKEKEKKILNRKKEQVNDANGRTRKRRGRPKQLTERSESEQQNNLESEDQVSNELTEKKNEHKNNIHIMDKPKCVKQHVYDGSELLHDYNDESFRQTYDESLNETNSMEFLSKKSIDVRNDNRKLLPITPIKNEDFENELHCVDEQNEHIRYTNDTGLSKIHNINVKADYIHLNDFEADKFPEHDVLRELTDDDEDEFFTSHKSTKIGEHRMNTKLTISTDKPIAPIKLEQTEIILIDDCIADNFECVEVEEEYIYEFTESSKKCRILLNDITKRFPQLKDQASVKLNPHSPTITHSQLDKIKIEETESGEAIKGKSQCKPYKRSFIKFDPDSTIDVNNSNASRKKKNSKSLKIQLKLLQKEQSTWQCPHCVRMYHMRKPFEKHLKEEHQCNSEEIKELSRGEVDMTINSSQIFKCHICDKIYLMKKRLQDHVQQHGPDGNFVVKCPCYCSKYFATKDEAFAHAQKEHRDKIYCEICDKYCNGHDSLKNHKKHLHNNKEATRSSMQRNFICDKCGKRFPGRTSLTDHVRSDCGRKPLYHCTLCGKYLTTAGILKTHMLLHSENAPFQCDKCGKTFKVKAQYSTHIKTRHTDVKPFKCHLCPKRYPYRESLLTHMTVHTGIKRFLCNGCGKRFTCISNLQAHRKVHAETCGLLPLNAKATQYMGVQKGYLLLGAKPEAGVDYKETNTLIAKDIIDRDMPITTDINFPSAGHAEHLTTVPLVYPIFEKEFVDNSNDVKIASTTASSNVLQIPQLLSDLIEDDPNNFH